MEREWLASELEAGRSIESIARAAGRSPSTVAYWVNKFGLASQHAPRHAARGGLDRAKLTALVDEGKSTRRIAGELGVSQATVRHWLRRYGLETARTSRRRTSTRTASGTGTDAISLCPRHGETAFRQRSDGGWRCLKCRAEAVVARRRAVKAALVAEAGGACALCGYSRSPVALQFHHLDATRKQFAIAARGVARSMSAARAEASKCVLLCANCHAEVEAGIANIPNASRGGSPG